MAESLPDKAQGKKKIVLILYAVLGTKVWAEVGRVRPVLHSH